jgi:nicotinamide riboside kinase
VQTTIISLYGGPGTGKSTSAAYLYYVLKTQGANAELVREYVKDWAWEKRSFSTYDQLYFLGKQSRRESMLYGKADWVVTDSPVLMNAYYAQLYCPPVVAEGVKASAAGFYQHAEVDGHRHVHVFLKRSKPYNPAGRYQDEKGARELDVGIRTMLDGMRLKTVECDTTEHGLRNMLTTLMLSVPHVVKPLDQSRRHDREGNG